MRFLKTLCIAGAVGACAASPCAGQSYRIERIASGLNQPTYVTQAPGDPANILYYTTRTLDANPGFGADNDMGRVWRYDVNTRTSSLVLDLSDNPVTQDTGLHAIAFHPDFNTPDTPGFGKMYLSRSEPDGTALNRVEEYSVDVAGANPSYDASFSNLVLEYPNNAQINHTVNWLGFDPTAVGDERNYLYISTGDGSFGNSYNDGESPDGRPSQNPNDIAGKMLRVDVAGPDAYPGEDGEDKNFAIPDSNPIPAYNAANPGSPIDGLGEVWITGLRNVYRASFDRLTGDMWMGDVGEVFVEEVDFLKAGANEGGPPVDFGWPQREGTLGSDVPGAPDSLTNPFTGVTAIEPVQEFLHDGGGEAVIGGYLYRGPVEELQGKYFYSDFVTTGDTRQLWMLDFDRDTDPNTFNGDNGTNTDISALWQSLVYDPTDPSYSPDSSTSSSAGLDHIVSFGEDNAGNLYLVDFGNGSGFNGQYPGAGLGEIFRVTPVSQITVTVNRDTGEITFTGDLDQVSDILGYRVASMSGAINGDNLTPIAGRLDDSDGGDGSVDPNNEWQVTSAAGDMFEFSEESTDGVASLAAGQQFTLSPEDGWVRSIYEDLQLDVTLADGTVTPAQVVFVGNEGVPFQRSDLNFNGELDPGDWSAFKPNFSSDLTGLTAAEAYSFGDLDGDGDNDFDDFRLFQSDYIAALGVEAFESLGAVPEPSGLALVAGLASATALLRRRRAGHAGRCDSRKLACAAGACLIGLSATAAHAELRHQYTFNNGLATDSVGGAHGDVNGDVTANLGVMDFPGGDGDFIDLPGFEIQINDFVNASFESWFTFRGGGAWQRVFDFGSTNNSNQGEDYIFYTPASGFGDNRAAITDGGGGDEDQAIAGGPLNTDQLYHLVVVVDETQTDQLQVYLDGQFAGATGLDVSMEDLDNDNAYLGASSWTADPNLNGTMDEFRIYDHALSPAEVMASYQAGPTPLASLEIVVNTVTGAVSLVNGHAGPLDFDFYSVKSAAGALDAEGWNSLDEQGLDAIGGGEGESWDTLGQPGAEEVTEAFLLSASQADPSTPIELGRLFDPSVFGAGAEGDIEFEFSLARGDLIPGDVTYVTPDPQDGDFDGDGVVGPADYALWRDTLGSTTNLAADGDGDMVVDRDDYAIWAWAYGAADGALAGAPVAAPEPASLLLSLVASVGVLARR